MSQVFLPGQRWISEREPELGLGKVAYVTPRTVVIAFPACGETREYGQESAPLRRVRFRAGDTVQALDGQRCEVREVREEAGCLVYVGDITLSEADLGEAQRGDGPEERLRSGVSDRPEAFELRVGALRLQHRRRASNVRGFAGARIDLLPHQLSIAAEVTRRLAPRVLLADEVGLGKTIEAGLILHRMLATGRAARVLVLVPGPLVHQWFVELLRRFNLWFALYDAARCATEDGTNPFLEDQLVLADLELLVQDPARLDQALEAGWDLVVVDEAHHLTWSPTSASAAYATVEALGRATPGLLLLTATPEQLGLPGHFARLRLLDPDRFSDLASFERELEDARRVANLADLVQHGQALSNEDMDRLKAWLGADNRHALELGDRDALLGALLDRHGPGRVMFRNTRSAVPGFPTRVPHVVPLEGDPRSHCLEWQADVKGGGSYTPAFAEDPRVTWLVDLLGALGTAKVLLICRTSRKAEALEAALRLRMSIKMALFHEELSLVARDRAAAWFSEPRGARLLICSEIGSEGRNFQMAHHLVLFDLPGDPALLEQRIGRLDRIGQTEAIHIHVPFVTGSPQEALVRWYHEGLDAFRTCVHGGREMAEAFGQRVGRVAAAKGLEGLGDLLEDTRRAYVEVRARLDMGRDRLLEMQSRRLTCGEALVNDIREGDEDRSLDAFLLSVFEQHFIQVEELAPRTWRLGSAGVLVESFPGLPEDGVCVTCDRQRALAREDLQFLSWDHPLVNGALDLVLGTSAGTSGFAHWPDRTHRGIYLEAIYVLETHGPARLHADRFLPPTPLRVLVDLHGKDQSQILPRSAYVRLLRQDARGMLTVRAEAIHRMLASAHAHAQERTRPLVARARAGMANDLHGEIQRLEALRRINPAVRQAELDQLHTQAELLDQVLAAARVRLDAARVIRRA